MKYPLKILRRGAADIDEKFDSIKRRLGQSSASRWRDRLAARLIDLQNQPLLWPLAEEADDLGLLLRETLIGRRRHVYRILYTFDGTTVYIHRVRHAAQDRLGPGDV